MTPSICKFTLSDSEPDVQIITSSREFYLHSQVLRLCSRWFAASMSEVWWKSENSTSSFKYCYCLNLDKDGFSTLLPRKCQESVQTKLDIKPEDLPTTADLGVAFERMFRCFYRMPVRPMNTTECTDLVSLADQYDALDSVLDPICASLFELQPNDLDRLIQDTPVLFLVMAYKLKSARIFKEAFVHVVGKQLGHFNTDYKRDSDIDIPEPVVLLIKSECDRINQCVFEAMRLFLRLDPMLLVLSESGRRSKEALRNNLGRLFELHGSPGDEGVLFRSIAEISSSLQSQLTSLVTGVAKELSVNNLRLKKHMRYLTCARLSDKELPWVY